MACAEVKTRKAESVTVPLGAEARDVRPKNQNRVVASKTGQDMGAGQLLGKTVHKSGNE